MPSGRSFREDQPIRNGQTQTRPKPSGARPFFYLKKNARSVTPDTSTEMPHCEAGRQPGPLRSAFLPESVKSRFFFPAAHWPFSKRKAANPPFLCPKNAKNRFFPATLHLGNLRTGLAGFGERGYICFIDFSHQSFHQICSDRSPPCGLSIFHFDDEQSLLHTNLHCAA
jgi:hypothetical protein